VEKEVRRIMEALNLKTLIEFRDAPPIEGILYTLQNRPEFGYNDDEAKTWVTHFERFEFISRDKADTIRDRLYSGDEEDDYEEGQ
jgi:hypothetical protein